MDLHLFSLSSPRYPVLIAYSSRSPHRTVSFRRILLIWPDGAFLGGHVSIPDWLSWNQNSVFESQSEIDTWQRGICKSCKLLRGVEERVLLGCQLHGSGDGTWGCRRVVPGGWLQKEEKEESFREETRGRRLLRGDFEATGERVREGKTGNECKAKTGFQQGHLVFLFHHKVTTISPVGVFGAKSYGLPRCDIREGTAGTWMEGFHHRAISLLGGSSVGSGTVIALMDDKEIKVPKVLLVEDFNAKLSDFRLFKQGPSQEVVSPSRQVNLLPNCSLKPWNFQLIQHICHVRPPLGPSPAGFHSCSRGRGVSCSICGSRLECHENEGESAAASTDQIESPHEENAREKRKSSSSKTDAPLLLDLQVEEIKYVFEVKTFQRRELLVLSTLQWKSSDALQYNRGFILLSIFPPRLFRGPFHAEAVKHLLNTIKDSFTREPGIKVQHANFQASKAVDYGATVRAAILSGDSNYSSPSATIPDNGRYY
ncbi:hypothetical protein CK203_117006 [Vitis vinifera]|uniref:Uncharacterized protein n=1 Tax=Vitis vinifera TaxID=29760 RepID=A0A438CPI0_VITVI|nr:hypothetical protein CK203_117006 [Vitis vinifera]